MATKLIFTVEKEIVDQAKAYARKNGRSLSELIESYLKILVQRDINQNDLPPGIKRLLGSVKAPKGFNYKKDLGKVLIKKYSN